MAASLGNHIKQKRRVKERREVRMGGEAERVGEVHWSENLP